VYCSIGKRSDEITKMLGEAGFTNARNLYGGIFEWVNQGHPVFNSQNYLFM
jgi:rhodanese-related sulfurtransferase